MAIDQKALLQAIYDTIFDSLTATPSGVPAGPSMSRVGNYLSLNLVGNPVDPADFATPFSPTNPTGSLLTAENFARLVDVVPQLSPVYAPGGSVEQLYEEIVRANVQPPAPDPAGEAAYNRAYATLYRSELSPDGDFLPTPGYQVYLNRRNAYDTALMQYNATYRQYDLTNPDERRTWEIVRVPLAAAVDRAYRNLQLASPGVYITAESTVAQYQQSSLARIFTEARVAFEQSARETTLDPDNPNIRPTYHLSAPFPANWYDPAAATNFSAVTLTSNRMRLSEDSRFTRYSGRTGFWIFGASGSSSSEQYDLHSETTNMRLSFKFGVVQVRRLFWYRSQLLTLRGWSTAGRQPGDYSNGRAQDNPGVFPLLPTAFVVARDINISASWGSEDVHRASQSTSASASIGWGPFKLSGSYSSGQTVRQIQSSFDGTTLQVPGAQASSGASGSPVTSIPASCWTRAATASTLFCPAR
jgi:hypothetical protein